MKTSHAKTGIAISRRLLALATISIAALIGTPAFAGTAKSTSCPANFSDYQVSIFSGTSPANVSADPAVTVYPPSVASGTYKVLGGGAIVHTIKGDAFLTASYPDIDPGTTNPAGWTAVSKRQGTGVQARITAYVIAVLDPANCWDVKVFQHATTQAVAHPTTSVTLDTGYVLTGGGGKATPTNPKGNGNFLFSSVPITNGWSVHSKDHGISDPANITAYAIGIKPAQPGVNTPVSNASPGRASSSLTNPSAYADGYNGVLPGVNCTLTGGGGDDNWGNGYGNLLTAIYPAGNSGWQSFGRSYGTPNVAVLTAYTVCLN